VKVWNDFDEDVPFPVELKGEEVASLAMAKKDAAIVIVSDNAEGGTVTVKPDAATLGLKAGYKAYDFETGKELALKDGAVDVTLKRHDFAIIEFK